MSNSEEGSTKTDLYGNPIGQQGKKATPRPADDAHSPAEQDGATPKTFTYDYKTKYRGARATASFIEFIGYLFIVFSIVVIYLSVDKADVAALMTGAMLFPLFIGALIVMLSQLVKATLDNADNTGELLAIMKARDDL